MHDIITNMKNKFLNYWNTPRGKFFTLAFVIFVALATVEYGLVAIFASIFLVLITYFLTTDTKFISRYHSNVLLLGLALVEVISKSLLNSEEFGIISMVISSISVSSAAFISIILNLSILIAPINLYRFSQDKKVKF